MKDKSPGSNQPIRISGVDETRNALDALKAQFENFKRFKRSSAVPKHSDVLIIGGGIIGSFVAYWLRTLSPTISCTVIEKDPNYKTASTNWSIGAFTQQFSLPEKIQMSLFGAEFLRDSKKHLQIENEELDFPVNIDGHLLLASKKNADKLYESHKIQLTHNAKVVLLDKQKLKEKFNWLNVDDIELASYGWLNEGWVYARKYLHAIRRKADYIGADFVTGNLVKFESNDNKILNTALIDTYDGKLVPIKFQTVVNAAGPWSSNVARLAGIGSDKIDSLNLTPTSVSLPVEARKRYIFKILAENGPILNTPLTMDPTGVFFKRSGLSNFYLCGLDPDEEDEPSDLNLRNIDYNYFENKIKPILINRVPTFKDLKLVDGKSWAGYLDYNSFDQNLIIGRHPNHLNFIFANGTTNTGLQHAPAIGRAVSELISAGQYLTIDLKRFGFERVMRDRPLREINIFKEANSE